MQQNQTTRLTSTALDLSCGHDVRYFCRNRQYAVIQSAAHICPTLREHQLHRDHTVLNPSRCHAQGRGRQSFSLAGHQVRAARISANATADVALQAFLGQCELRPPASVRQRLVSQQPRVFVAPTWLFPSDSHALKGLGCCELPGVSRIGSEFEDLGIAQMFLFSLQKESFPPPGGLSQHFFYRE